MAKKKPKKKSNFLGFRLSEEILDRLDLIAKQQNKSRGLIAKDAIERAGTLDKSTVWDAIETTNMDQMLIITESGKIEFSTETETYHEIAPFTFVEQLFYDEQIGETRPLVIWPDTAPGVGTIKQTDFILPDNYEPGPP